MAEPVRDLFFLSLHKRGYTIFRFPRFNAQPQSPADVESLRKIYNRIGDYKENFQILRKRIEIVSVEPSVTVNLSLARANKEEVCNELRDYFQRNAALFRGHSFGLFDPTLIEIQTQAEIPQPDFSPRVKLLLKVFQQHIDTISEPLVPMMITEQAVSDALRAAEEKRKIKEKGLGTCELRLNLMHLQRN